MTVQELITKFQEQRARADALEAQRDALAHKLRVVGAGYRAWVAGRGDEVTERRFAAVLRDVFVEGGASHDGH